MPSTSVLITLPEEIQVIGERMPRSSRCTVCSMTRGITDWFVAEWDISRSITIKLSQKRQLGGHPLEEPSSKPAPPATSPEAKDQERVDLKEKVNGREVRRVKEKAGARAKVKAKVDLRVDRLVDVAKGKAAARDGARRLALEQPEQRLRMTRNLVAG